MLEDIDIMVDKMPQPEFVEEMSNLTYALIERQNQQTVLTISWQWILADLTEALIAHDSKRVFKLLFSDLVDYAQLNHNAVEDIRSLVRQPLDKSILKGTQTKIEILKIFMNEYLTQPESTLPWLKYLINESSLIVEELKSLKVVGVGAFMIASGFHIALLQEQAALEQAEWSRIKKLLVESSQYVASVTPKLFRLSVGLIDKQCRCTKGNFGSEPSKQITQYECHYFDGKDIHIFQAISPDAVTECNKHRLQTFKILTDRVNETAAKPVRAASDKWLKLAARI